MTDISELERQNAELRKQLEAAQAAPVSGWGGLFSVVGSVVALVPRWLVVAAGVVAVAFIGTDAYLKIRAQLAATEQAEAEVRKLTGGVPNSAETTARLNALITANPPAKDEKTKADIEQSRANAKLEYQCNHGIQEACGKVN